MFSPSTHLLWFNLLLQHHGCGKKVWTKTWNNSNRNVTLDNVKKLSEIQFSFGGKYVTEFWRGYMVGTKKVEVVEVARESMR